MEISDEIINKTIMLSGFQSEKISQDMKESLKRIVLFAGKINAFKDNANALENFVSVDSLRDDSIDASLPRNELLSNAQNTIDGFFTVNKILE